MSNVRFGALSRRVQWGSDAEQEEMMDFKKLTDKAKGLVDKRGGTESLKEDAEELKSIASSKGSLSDKAKAAVEAIKDPGDDPTSAQPAPSTPAAQATPDEAERAAAKVDGEERGKHGHGEGGQRRGGRGGGGGGRGRGGGRRGGRDGDPAA